jgi:Ser-tRNA(Ala) deacylase AlaX
MSEAAVFALSAPAPVPAAADLFPATQLDYLLDSYVFSATARVLSASATELVLDRTIFHPQGGGQPSDVGVVRSADGAARFAVAAAKKDTVGDPHAPATMHTIVRHAGAYESNAHFAVGDEVVLDVDERVRRLHARLHSAGHLIDVAMERAGYALKAAKGSHSPDMAFVEYAGTIESGEMEAARERLQDICSTLIAEARPVSAVVVPFETLREKCGFGTLCIRIRVDCVLECTFLGLQARRIVLFLSLLALTD